MQVDNVARDICRVTQETRVQMRVDDVVSDVCQALRCEPRKFRRRRWSKKGRMRPGSTRVSGTEVPVYYEGVVRGGGGGGGGVGRGEHPPVRR